MDERLRLHYLQAMGIDVWLPQAKAASALAPSAKYQWAVLLDAEALISDTDTLLNELLTAMALDRKQVLVMMFDHDCMASIANIQPKMVVVMGEQAAQNLLQTTMAMAELRGVKHALSVGATSVSVVVSFSLTYLLQVAIDKRLAWQDMQLALKVFNGQVNQETK